MLGPRRPPRCWSSALALAIFQQIIGINTVIYYAPTILKFTGHSTTSAITQSVFVGITNVVFTIVAILLLDKLGRRLLPARRHDRSDRLARRRSGSSSPRRGLQHDAPVRAGLPDRLHRMFRDRLGPVFWLMISEIFPLQMRGPAMAVCTVVNWALQLPRSPLRSSPYQRITKQGTFWLYAALRRLRARLLRPASRRRRTARSRRSSPISARMPTLRWLARRSPRLRGRSGFAPIGSYAAIGDGRTVALVAADGSLDFMSLPSLQAPTTFAAILDPERGGRFTLAPSGAFEAARRYLERTNVLETTYRTGDGVARVTEALTLQDGGLLPWVELARRVEGIEGSVRLEWRLEPRFDWGREAPEIVRRGELLVAEGAGLQLTVHSWDAGEVEAEEDALAGSSRSRQASARCSRSSPPTSSRCTRRAATTSRRDSTRRGASGSAGSASGRTTARGRRRSRAARSRSSCWCTRRTAASRPRRQRRCRR